MTAEAGRLQAWVGREERSTDLIALSVVARARAFFGIAGEAQEGDALPELWHWFFFHPAVGQGGLGPDGHPKVGGFLPDFGLPRRMWGGSELAFAAPLRVGQEAEKVSKIVSVDLKQGASGPLGLVRVEHRISQGGAPCVTELQDIVYREAASGPQGRAVAPDCPGGAVESRKVMADAVTLFRFSALTWNAHRIHYDRDYATRVEGYPSLVVHGPFTAARLALLASAAGKAPMREFSFRGTSPLFDGAPFTIHTRPEANAMTLWAERPEGGMAMMATAVF